MCESNVYLIENNTETLIMENVAAISPAGENRFVLRGLLGDQRQVSGIIEEINLMGHKIILRAV
jgi:predicted RNA-binding protein